MSVVVVVVFNFYTFIYLVLAVLGLRFCTRALSSCGEWGPPLIAVHRPLTVAASPVAEHRLQTRRLSTCGPRAQLLRGMWDLPRPGLEPASPALAGGLSTTAPPGKPMSVVLNHPGCGNSLPWETNTLSIKPQIQIFFLAALHAGPWFPDQGSNLRPLHWKHGLDCQGSPPKFRWIHQFPSTNAGFILFLFPHISNSIF